MASWVPGAQGLEGRRTGQAIAPVTAHVCLPTTMRSLRGRDRGTRLRWDQGVALENEHEVESEQKEGAAWGLPAGTLRPGRHQHASL